MVKVYQANTNIKSYNHTATTVTPTLPQVWRAALYVRKSNESEGQSKSVAQQTQHCRLAAQRLGITDENVTVYDEDEGFKGEWYFQDGAGHLPAPYRPELTRLIRDIEAGKIDAVFIWRSDRLYRDAGVCDAIVKVLRKHGTKLYCGIKEMDVASSSGLYQASTEAANNRRWRDQISEDIKRDHDFKAELGMFTRNPACMGFRSKGKGTQEVVPMWDEIDLVIRVFRLFVDGIDIATGEQVGPLGTTAIAKYLMDNGVTWPKGAKGHTPKHISLIHESQVRRVLTNCMYVGRWRHNGLEYECDKLFLPVRADDGSIIEGQVRETVVPMSLYEAAQEKLARGDRPGRRSLSSEHLLTGLAVCGRCGRPLQVHFTAYKSSKNGKPRDPRRNFLCTHQRGDRPCAAGSIVRVQEPVLDEWAITELAPLIALEIEAMRTVAGREADRQTLAALEKELSQLREKETQSLAALVGVMDASQFAAVAQKLRCDRETIERRRDEVKKRVDDAERSLPILDAANLHTMPTATVKNALSRAIDWIAVCKEGVVAKTSWGAYIGATYRKRISAAEQVGVTYINAPELVATLTSLSMLADADHFVWGRRMAMGKRAKKLTDEEILPGANAECSTGGRMVVETISLQ